MNRRYEVVDVFTSRPLRGNPVAVVLDAQDLSSETMQAIARWTNLSETTFVLPPTDTQADYRLRIFTPRSELPFAGHPTLGSAHAVLKNGHIAPRHPGRLIQQCDVGLVEVTIDERDGGRELSFSLPPAKIETLSPDDVIELERIVGCRVDTLHAPATVDVGPVWVVAHLPDVATVLDLRPDLTALAAFERRTGVTGLTVFGRHEQGNLTIEVRTFAPSCGVDEDPVCGSGNGSVAVYQWAQRILPPDGCEYLATQGRCVGRDGKVKVRLDGQGHVWIGGACVSCVEGVLAA
ncbi:PhzF family phenazine biosynthesis protein [Burkholderia metallica]|uniref:PhzF family phenazine biosynthesis protein n=1 Tax=Burkholderia metallica TaxID=488729 RepID=A0ABT8PA12_9BURK|nr:PhzF family phenazine biosynthesis protein [Burkholderia metallica]AOJ33064.1 phenazine biosynthesis protein PhzF [Burkholderia metallica]MCA7999053.1 PhzF family phenazine biosynthesis protein [Burkholderia metallica]MDN7931906.1 PhzF family phenazine biosynthesis protein [Burkholderia metallica]